jgi:hypothetical protein
LVLLVRHRHSAEDGQCPRDQRRRVLIPSH